MRQLHQLATLRRKPAPIPAQAATSHATGGEEPRPGARTAPLVEMVDALEGEILDAFTTVAQAIGNAADSVGGAGDGLAEVGRGTKDLAETGQDAAAQGGGLAASAEELVVASGGITTAMDVAARTVHDALSLAQGATAAVIDLARVAEEMVGIVDTIAAVARQANLVAVNATIEAARAGEAGRDFALVAGDVKSLSMQANGAANDIRARLMQLRESAGASVHSAEKVASVIQDVQPALGIVRGAFDNHNAAVAELARRANEVSGSAGRVSEKAENIDATARTAAARVAQAAQTGASAEALARSLGQRLVTIVRQNEAGDRRRHDRYPINVNVTLHVGAHSLDTHTIDISAGGMLLANLHAIALAPGYTIAMEIERLGRLPARVVAISPIGLHCAFTDLDDEANTRLAQVLAEIEEDYRPLIVVAKQAGRRVEAMLEQALAQGRLTPEQLFDSQYRPIPGTDPQQYEAASTQVLEDVLPAVQEPLLLSDNRMSFCVAIDRNGYTPVHNRKYSLPQRPGDVAWNTANACNKRIFDQRAALIAARSSRPFVIQSFARDMGGGRTVMIREIDVPIRVRGRHWGGLRMGYQF